MTPQISLPPLRAGGIDLTTPGDFQQPGGGPPEGFPYKDVPVPDAVVREPLFSNTLTTLHTRFDPRSDALVSGDVFIYYRDEYDLPRAMAPDLLAIFGPDLARYRDRYGLSLREIGKAPDFVMEVASPSTYRADLGYKRDAYHWMGAGEFWLCDPDGGQHYGQQMAWEKRGDDGEYYPMPVHTTDDGIVWAHSPALGLDVCLDGDRLRFYDPEAGEYLRSLSESEAERLHAEAALTAEQVAHEMARTALASAQAARAGEQAARHAAETARAEEQAARHAAETAHAQEQAARQAAEAQVQQLLAQLRPAQEGQSPSP